MIVINDAKLYRELAIVARDGCNDRMCETCAFGERHMCLFVNDIDNYEWMANITNPRKAVQDKAKETLRSTVFSLISSE